MIIFSKNILTLNFSVAGSLQTVYDKVLLNLKLRKTEHPYRPDLKIIHLLYKVNKLFTGF